MAKSKDLFDDSTMSFGEHLEILRVHLWKAIVGLVIAVTFALFIGNQIVAVIRGPIDKALKTSTADVQDNMAGFNFWEYIKSKFGGETPSRRNRITDEGLGRLESLKQLQRVDLSSTHVTADGMRKLKAAHPRLHSTVDPLVVAGLEQLEDLGARCDLNDDYEVVALSLSGPDFTNSTLELLAGMAKLERLDLKESSVTDKGMKQLAGLTALKQLNLRETAVTDIGLAHLAGLKNLQQLNLRNTAITDAGLAHLKTLTGLHELNLYLTSVTDAGLEHLKPLKNLRKLSVGGPQITAAGMKHLSGLTSLESLSFSNTRISDEGLAHLAGLKKLRELNFFSEPRQEGQRRPHRNAVEADRSTILVSVDAEELVPQLPAGATPNSDGSASAADEEAKLVFNLSAPEFAQFRETTEKVDSPITLNVQEAFLTYIKVSMVAGLIFASPWVFYQIWQFVAAGLYPHEQKYVYTYLPISIFLFVGGAVFCFYLVFPYILDFLLGFNKWLGVVPQIRLSEWISFAIMLPLMFGISFQLPLVMLFLERISIFDANDYREKRRISILVIAVISMLMTPADPMSMLLMMFPLLLLYELGIYFCKLTAQKSPFEAEAA